MLVPAELGGLDVVLGPAVLDGLDVVLGPAVVDGPAVLGGLDVLIGPAVLGGLDVMLGPAVVVGLGMVLERFVVEGRVVRGGFVVFTSCSESEFKIYLTLILMAICVLFLIRKFSCSFSHELKLNVTEKNNA